MALLFSNVAEQYVSKKQAEAEEDSNKLSARVSALFDALDEDDDMAVDNDIDNIIEDNVELLPQQMFMTSVATQYYKKSIDDIKNTKIGNKCIRRKNFQQVMKESFFYGANRFGTNFIA